MNASAVGRGKYTRLTSTFSITDTLSSTVSLVSGLLTILYKTPAPRGYHSDSYRHWTAHNSGQPTHDSLLEGGHGVRTFK